MTVLQMPRPRLSVFAEPDNRRFRDITERLDAQIALSAGRAIPTVGEMAYILDLMTEARHEIQELRAVISRSAFAS